MKKNKQSTTATHLIDDDTLETAIRARGKAFFASIGGEAPSVFNKAWWTGKLMDWAMKSEQFKVQLFRFVDVLPYLTTSESLSRHIDEYFIADGQELPSVLRWGAKLGAKSGDGFTGRMLGKAIRSNLETMAKQFIVGQTSDEALKNLRKLRKQGFAFAVDILGEATVSEVEAEQYQKAYLDLLAALAAEQKNWNSLGEGNSDLDWGHAPKINISIKPSCLYSQATPADFEGSVEAICARLRPLLSAARQANAFLCIDMEQHALKQITLAVYRRLRGSAEFRDYQHLGIVLQSYLRQTDEDLDALLRWAKSEQLPISVRLVKGAYWDYETVIAAQNAWPVPVYTCKAETDAAFERQARVILQNHDICHLACGSHNIRSIAAVAETAAALDVPEHHYEFQVLYGMAEPVRKGLRNIAERVRLYCPFGELLPGMAYLVRRLLENTANESFLRQSFVEGAEADALLVDPAITASAAVNAAAELSDKDATPQSNKSDELALFDNESVIDFTVDAVHEEFSQALESVRKKLCQTYPLLIGGAAVTTDDLIDSVNPANPQEVIGRICQADRPQIDQAIDAAKQAFDSWRHTPVQERVDCLFAAAEIARKRIYELSAWQVLEVGKQWDQAHADVCEAIDFLQYYGREMLRLGTPKRMGRHPGELNHYGYRPKGIVAVIAPWNFPLAISCGMTSAAIVTGNCVLYKPSGLSSVIGQTLTDLYVEAGVPAGVFNYVPGRGSVIGDYVVDHPDTSMIAFTGSVEVGLRIIERASKVHPGQTSVKRVIAEMGGKNAIIIDDDADLDEAVHGVMYSAFAFQGQKCSACSRVIVVDSIYDRFVERLVEAAKSIKLGPAEDPSNRMGPVVDANAQRSILEYVKLAEQEGNILVQRSSNESGYYVPLTIVEGIEPHHRLAQEEIFGPVLAIMWATDFDDAIAKANSTRYALTGGVYSRSPRHLEQARREFYVGNLYLNRGCTGALVERQPFGGYNMSGIGTKAGGPDYLLQFMDPKAVSENTMRRGFAPEE